MQPAGTLHEDDKSNLRPERGTVRDQILQTGLQQIAVNGLINFSMRQIQRSAGKAETVMFKIWDSKSEFSVAVADFVDEIVAGRIRAQRRPGEPAINSLYAALDTHIRLATQLPAFVALPSVRHLLQPSALSFHWWANAVEKEYSALAELIAAETRQLFRAPYLGSALSALAEGMALAASRARKARPVEAFIQLAQGAAHAMVDGFLGLPRPQPQPMPQAQPPRPQF